MAEPLSAAQATVNGAAAEAGAVKELVEEREAWPLVRYEDAGRIDWLKLVNAWTAVGLGFLEVVLAFRLGFRLAAANAANGFVDAIYDVSGPMVWPFKNVLADTELGASGAFQPSILIAMLVYFVAAVLLMSVAWAVVQTNEARAPTIKSHPRLS